MMDICHSMAYARVIEFADTPMDVLQVMKYLGGPAVFGRPPRNPLELEAQLVRIAARDPQTRLLIEGDRMARYESVAQALAAAHRSGLKQVGFVTEKIKETP